ncbi:hypothetical protein [Streptomyces sp. NRRL S-813]|nr:hypothetical protein [Streptomyces sp. NRRL S-813]
MTTSTFSRRARAAICETARPTASSRTAVLMSAPRLMVKLW